MRALYRQGDAHKSVRRFILRFFVAGSILIFGGASCTSISPTDADNSFSSPLDSLNALIDGGEGSAEDLLARARIQFNSDELAAAKRDIDSAFARSTNDFDLLLLRGDIYYRLNGTRVARDSWIRAAELNPKDPLSRNRLAELFLAVRDYLKALKYVNEVLELDASSGEALFLKGYIYLELEDTTNAVRFIAQSIDANPDYFEAYDLLGVISASRGESAAVDFYQKAAELQPQNSMIQYKLGLFYQNRAQWNDAIEAYFKAVELDPNNQYAHFNLGYIHTELDLFELARDHFTNAIRANDRYEQAYYGRAYALESLGQLDRAKLDYETALNINYEYEPAKEGLGRVSKILQETGKKH